MGCTIICSRRRGLELCFMVASMASWNWVLRWEKVYIKQHIGSQVHNVRIVLWQGLCQEASALLG